MTDKTADPRPMDADIDPIAYFEKLRAANHQRAFKETHPDYYVSAKLMTRNARVAAAGDLPINPIPAATLLLSMLRVWT
jgi:hypothetical protein